MKIVKRILSQLHSFVLWLLISALFWSWIFTFVTDTSAERKVTLYCKVPAMQDVDLAAALEERMPEGLKMIQAHSFDYVMFGTDAFYQGDLFIVPESEIEAYAELLVPVEGEQGARVYDASAAIGAATAYISYGEEDYYLFLGAGSVHLEDGKALEVARALMALE